MAYIGTMAQGKTQRRRKLTGVQWLAMYETRAGAGMRQWPIYSTSTLHPGKFVQRLPDGTEVVGTFRDGAFVAERSGQAS